MNADEAVFASALLVFVRQCGVAGDFGGWDGSKIPFIAMAHCLNGVSSAANCYAVMYARLRLPMDILEISNDPLSPWRKLEEFEVTFLKNEKRVGASACFVGTMRDFNEGDKVTAMTLEHYPAMTQRQLQHIIKKSYQQWPLLHTLLVHRVGQILPSEPIVVVAAWSAHRGAAFDACRFLMEELKHSAPFWKKEQLLNGDERWVTHNTKAE